MGREGLVTASMGRGEKPDWRPLQKVLSDEQVSEFMWMYDMWTPAGERMQAYKHIDTRRYLHLDEYGNAFVYVDEATYRRLPLADLLERVLPRHW